MSISSVAREPAPPAFSLPDEPSLPRAGAAAATDGPSPFAALLESLAHEVHDGESLTRAALGAARARQALGPAELIALQAGIYRYGEAVDLASRLIDRATGAVKTVVQGS
jgi:hypothetical protein